MATVDLGKISFTQKGTWNSGTAYVAKDVVQYVDDNETSSYVAVASSTNQTPSTNGTVNTSYWVLFAKGATVGSTNQGVWNIATAYQKNAVVQYTDTGVVSTYLAVADSTGETPSSAGTVNSTYWQLIAKGTDSVGLAWQSTIVTGTTLSAVAGNGYWINTTSNACTITLPASASVGDQIIFTDYARTWNTNNVTLNINGLNYQGGTENPVYDTASQTVNIVYSGATNGWIPISDDDVTNEQSYNINFLVVAGGGSGGSGNAGGGGAGGLLTNLNSSPIFFETGRTYTLTVGSGGGASPNGNDGNDGNDSTITGLGFSTITAFGGGGGGYANNVGRNGGSGGGNGHASTSGTAGQGTLNQGNNGGTANTGAPDYGAGGGGGAGAVGDNGTAPRGGDGGIGLLNSITGSPTYYAGGGGGSSNSYSENIGLGGNGGGGNGGANPITPQPGTANTGGGGGGSGGQPELGGVGGSGVIILRMATADYTGTTTGSPTVTTSGSDTILTFTGTGTYTA